MAKKLFENEFVNEVVKAVGVSLLSGYLQETWKQAGETVAANRKRRLEREIAQMERQERLEKLLQESEKTLRTMQGKLDKTAAEKAICAAPVEKNPTDVERLEKLERQISRLQSEAERLKYGIMEAHKALE